MVDCGRTGQPRIYEYGEGTRECGVLIVRGAGRREDE